MPGAGRSAVSSVICHILAPAAIECARAFFLTDEYSADGRSEWANTRRPTEMTSTATATEAAAPKATRREWIGLGVLALACLLYVMDLTVLHLAVPAISADLHPTSAQLLWIIDIYGFMVAGFLITMGTLGDRIGRRRLLLIGAAAFGAVS